MAVKSESMLVNHLSAAIANRKENVAMQYAIVTAVTLLAAVLRFFKLSEWSFWIDEIATINRALGHFNLETMLEQWWRPPLSIILTGGILNLFGISEWSARLTSALIGVISIPIFYFLARSLLNQWVAFSAAILLAVSPWHIFWSQNARFYTSLMLLYFIASIAFFLFIENGRLKYLILFCIFFFFAFSERFIAILIVPVLFFYLLSLWILPFEKPVGFKARYLAFLTLPVIGYVLLELYSYLTTSTTRLAFAMNTFGGQQFDDPPRLIVAIVYNIGLPILSLALFGGAYLFLHRSRSGLFILLSAAIPFVTVILLNPITFTKDRYVFMTLPFWLILAAVVVKELITQTRDYGRLLAVGVLFLLLIEASGTNLLYYQVNNGNRRDWREAFEIIKEKGQEDDAVVAWWPEFSPFYLGREIIRWEEINPETVANSGKRYWFVVDSETVWGNVRMNNWLKSNAELIEVLYLRLPEDDFNLRIYLYDPARPAPGG